MQSTIPDTNDNLFPVHEIEKSIKDLGSSTAPAVTQMDDVIRG
jgi:hypothetical protein